MTHWKHEPEREDEDGKDDLTEATRARKWLRREVSKRTHTDPLYGMLSDLELSASPFYLGMDYDSDTDDVDEVGPY